MNPREAAKGIPATPKIAPRTPLLCSMKLHMVRNRGFRGQLVLFGTNRARAAHSDGQASMSFAALPYFEQSNGSKVADIGCGPSGRS